MKHAIAIVALLGAMVAPVAVQVTHCPKESCVLIGPGTHRDRQRPVLYAVR